MMSLRTRFPPQHRTKLHSTNPVERLNGEIKRPRLATAFRTTSAKPALAVVYQASQRGILDRKP
jgi:transposase-like protein